jgi:hypothetical protein
LVVTGGFLSEKWSREAVHLAGATQALEPASDRCCRRNVEPGTRKKRQYREREDGLD